MTEVQAPAYFLPKEEVDDAVDEIVAKALVIATSLIKEYGLEVKVDEYIGSLPPESRNSTRATVEVSLAYFLAQKAIEVLDRKRAEAIAASFE
ncbi:MAG: hypothetical protein AAB734_00865 [Patescibacteria group bacterium]